jgi:phosphoenolpyruvate carboxykinase (ATP)
MFSNAKVHYQLSVDELVQQTLSRNEGRLSDTGALVIYTGEFTGRSPSDKFLVKDDLTEHTVDWNKFNNPISESHFLLLKDDLVAYLDRKEEIWIRNACACASVDYQINLRVITESPASNHFAANMFIKPGQNKQPVWTIIHAPGFKAKPDIHGTRQANFTVVSFTHRTILIGGTGYTGEMKKSVFTVLNFILPLDHGVLSMHCSANEGDIGDTALFFGLSGTGKTTLSSDPNRKLIGDDEHGWDDRGIFNIEGGCYAKVINLSQRHEPAIFGAIKKGALVENTGFEKGSNRINYKCSAITENTRVSYPVDFITNSKKPSVSGLPKHIFFLTCDAYGVLPPISKLNVEQAIFYFLNGYTAKIAGTEEGLSEPQATFSACFGAPFLPLKPEFYAGLLKDKIHNNQCDVWMINTGWTGGGYNEGKRIELPFTRAMITAVLSGALNSVGFRNENIFNLDVPVSCPGVPGYLLDPSRTWTDMDLYLAAAEKLLKKFIENSTTFSKRL